MRSIRKQLSIVAAGIVILCLACGDGKPGESNPPAQRKPNIVFIIMDLVRNDNVVNFSMNNPRAMPFFASMKEKGTLFENVITPDSWTVPSHLEFLSGRDLENFKDVEKTYTLAAHLRKNGYLCIAILDNFALCVKKSTFDQFQFIQTFESYKGMQNMMGEPSPDILKFANYEAFLSGYQGTGVSKQPDLPSEDIEKWTRLISAVTDGYKESNDIVWPEVRKYYQESDYFEFRYQNLIGLLEAQGGKEPFFLFVNLIKYVPESIVYEVKAKWLVEFIEANSGIEMDYRELDFLPQQAVNYFEIVESLFTSEMGRVDMNFSVMLMDAIIEDLMTFLYEGDYMTEKDYTFISTDHGYTYGEEYPHGLKPAMYKHTGELVLPVVHSFILAKGPDFPGGERAAGWACVTDIYRTIAEKVPQGLPEKYFNDYTTRSLSDRRRQGEDAAIVLTQSESQVTSVFYKGHKLKWKIDSEEAPVLIHWTEDPFERGDLSSKQPELLEEMKELARGYWKRRKEMPEYVSERTDAEKENRLSPDAIENLKALGYLN
jgi:hypothetical protein